LNSNRTYCYGHLDRAPFILFSFPFPLFLFLLSPFPCFGGLALSLGLLSSLLTFVALLSFFGNSFCYLRVTVCRLPLLAFPACPSFSGLSFRRLPMAVRVIPVFRSFFGSYLRHLRVAVLCPSYPLCARRCCCACDNSCWLGLGGLLGRTPALDCAAPSRHVTPSFPSRETHCWHPLPSGMVRPSTAGTLTYRLRRRCRTLGKNSRKTHRWHPLAASGPGQEGFFCSILAHLTCHVRLERRLPC